MFITYPHGLLPYGYLVNFAAKSINFNELFPKIQLKACIHLLFYYTPFLRDIFKALGAIAVDNESITNFLSQSRDKNSKFTSNAAVILVGGAQETLYSSPGKYKIIIKNRKGFARLALETGSSLVPVFSFGEVDLLDLPMEEPKTLGMLKYWPQAILRHMTVGFFHPLPNKSPINTVVGAPIDVEKVSKPSKDKIDELHGKFMKELEKLFNEHKIKYLKNPQETQLEMV